MSHLFVDNEHIKLDIPLISVPQNDGKFLLVKNADGYEWKSYSGTTGGGGGLNFAIIACSLKVTDPVKYINTDCIELTFDGYKVKVFPWQTYFIIAVKNVDTISYEDNMYGTLSITQL